MIYIEDYSNLSAVFPQTWDLSEAYGRTVEVRTTAGSTYSGVVMAEDGCTITLAYTRCGRGCTARRKIVIAKRHIAAIDSGMY